MSFSERMGLVPQKSIQVNGIDAPLKNLLWDEVSILFDSLHSQFSLRNQEGVFLRFIWVEFFKWHFDSFHAAFERVGHFEYRNSSEYLKSVVYTFFFGKETPWFRLFDLIEYLLRLYQEGPNDETVNDLNYRLEQEKSGFRIVNKKFAPITNPNELAAVEKAIQPRLTVLTPVAMQLQQALAHLADRQQPDFRNSMKESISAVESLCKIVAKMPGATLGPALDKTARELDLNDHLRDGFKSIYKYTSDDHGIRHGLKDEEQPEQEDAQFFLVACSAFVNFVTEKARKLGKL